MRVLVIGGDITFIILECGLILPVTAFKLLPSLPFYRRRVIEKADNQRFRCLICMLWFRRANRWRVPRVARLINWLGEELSSVTRASAATICSHFEKSQILWLIGRGGSVLPFGWISKLWGLDVVLLTWVKAELCLRLLEVVWSGNFVINRNSVLPFVWILKFVRIVCGVIYLE